MKAAVSKLLASPVSSSSATITLMMVRPGSSAQRAPQSAQSAPALQSLVMALLWPSLHWPLFARPQLFSHTQTADGDGEGDGEESGDGDGEGSTGS